MYSTSLTIGHVRSIEDDYPDWQQMQQRPRGTMSIPTKMIIGTFRINSKRFDSGWMPREKDQRYDDLYSYMKGKMVAPESRDPIMLFKVGSDYYVSDDGNRRVAIAHRLGIPVVEAEVIQLLRP